MSETGRRAAVDGAAGRIAAGVVVLVCLGVLLYLNRALLLPGDAKKDAKLNPEFVACREERLGQVKKLQEQNLISDSQFETFSARAVELCAGQFPPDATKPSNAGG